MLTACGSFLGVGSLRRGNVDHVKVADWEPSSIYTDSDIEAAIQTVKDYFEKEFGGCTLTELEYVGDASADEFESWAATYNADEAIIFLSSFDVDSSGGDGSFEANSTYEHWNWILVRSKGGTWRHVTHGY